MHNDVTSLQCFYTSMLGHAVCERVTHALQPHLPIRSDENIMGLGYAIPYMDGFCADCDRCFVMMPAKQGAQIWPRRQTVASCLVFEENLPLPDSCLDRIVMVHALEHVENAREMMRELWRVLVPYGQIIIIVTNRHGLWSGADHTPFGSGEPYSRAQLTKLLQNTGFTVQSIEEILHLWPYKNWQRQHFSCLYEKVARRLFPFLGGLLLARAHRQTMSTAPAKRISSRRFFAPTLAPQAGCSAPNFKH